MSGRWTSRATPAARRAGAFAVCWLLLAASLLADTFRVVRTSPQLVIDAGAEFGIAPGTRGRLCWKQQVGERMVDVCPLAFEVIAAGTSESRLRITHGPAAEVAVSLRVKLDVPLALGVVVIHSTPTGARAFVDDSQEGETPLRLSLRPGSHPVRVEADGHEAWRGAITAIAGQVVEVSAILRPVTPTEPVRSVPSSPIGGADDWNEQRLAKAERERAAAERRARKQERARLEAERLAEQRQREKETLSLQRAQREQDFQESVEDIQTRLDRGDLNTAEILLEGLERDHPDKPAVSLLRENLDERRAAAAVAARQQQEAAAQRRRKEARRQELIPILRHHIEDRPTQGCFNQSIEYEIRGSRIRWPFYILAGEDRGDEIRPLLVRQLEDQTKGRYRVFSNAGRQNDLGSMKETFANWAGNFRQAGRVTFFLLYPEEYAEFGRPREEEMIRGAAYARLRELPSQTRGFEWPRESGCPR